jgi:uncharacterized protein (TIGR00661 family)
MKISIIIPTYNEEEYLPNLLKSIKSQNFDSYEIIVADASSIDSTVDIAKSYGCTIVKGGLPGIGRNNGAKVAKGELLLFLDSDLELTENYLEKVVDEFESRNIDIGITLMSPMSEKTRDKIFHDIANWFMIVFEKIKPHGAGCYGIITKKELHDIYGGFDESLNFGEDTDYIEKLAKEHVFKVLRTAKIHVSTRRLEEEGIYKLTKQYAKSTLNDFMGKKTDSKDLDYNFGHGKCLIEEGHLINLNNKDAPDEACNNLTSIEEFKENLNQDKKNLKEVKKTIFYSVCGEGLGHAIRSAVVIEQLLKKYNVFVFSSDRAYKYLNDKFDNVFEIGGFNTVYQDNTVKNRKTLYKAIKETPSDLKENYANLYKKAKEIKPNIIITDFENYSNIVAKIINVPVLSVDNIHMITQTKIDHPKHSQGDMLKSIGVIKSFFIRPKRYILTSFFYPEIKTPEKAVIYPPIIRDKIRQLKVEPGNHIIVYQTSPTNTKLINILKKINETFIIYGYDKDELDANLIYRKFNNDKIYSDMANSKAVITNGGFSLITEAIYLKKPIYSIPAKGNFEQLLNGFYVEKLGYGIKTREINIKSLKNFLSNLNIYQKNLKKVKNTDNSGIIKEIENSIEEFTN